MAYSAIQLAELPARERGVCCEPPRTLPRKRVDELTDVLKALADPTRVEIVSILREAKAPVCICDLTAAFELSQPTLSHHMAKLREAGIVEAEKCGIWIHYRLSAELPEAARRLVDAIG